MCYKPIRILSNKIDFDSRFDKIYFEVPCGKCCECQNSYIMSWSLRNYYEFLYCKDLRGVCMNFTLTYDDLHLPKLYGIPTFRKSDVQKFLKLLRKWLVKDGIIHDGSLRYFCTSEYGHLHGRPHMHIIFYVLEPVNVYTFYKYVQKFWKYGFVGYGNLGIEVRDFHALNYACKYMTKDSSYKSVVENVKMKYAELSDDKDLINFDDFFKDFRQFHLQSMSFGRCMLNYVDDNRLFLGRVLNPFSQDGKSELPVPLYIVRKVFYDSVKQDDGTYRYVLNCQGVLRKLKNLDNQILSATNKLLEYRQYPNDEHLLNELQAESIESFFHDLDVSFNSTMQVPLYSLYTYYYVYRDRCLNDYMSDNFRIDYLKYLTHYDDKKIEFVKNMGIVEKNTENICNYQQIFRIFEKWLTKLQAFKRYDAYQRELKSVKEYNVKQSQVALSRGSVPVYKDEPKPSDFFTYLLT